MKKSRLTEEQTIAVLHQQEAGETTAEVSRRHGISGETFYAWKAKFGAIGVSDARRLSALEDESPKLKRLRAEAMVDIAVLKDLTSKNGGARRRASGRRAGHARPWLERTPGVFPSGGGPRDGALSPSAAGRRGLAGAPARTLGRAPGPGGHQGLGKRLQPNATALGDRLSSARHLRCYFPRNG